jgi:hypothetical protein
MAAAPQIAMSIIELICCDHTKLRKILEQVLAGFLSSCLRPSSSRRGCPALIEAAILPRITESQVPCDAASGKA